MYILTNPTAPEQRFVEGCLLEPELEMVQMRSLALNKLQAFWGSGRAPAFCWGSEPVRAFWGSEPVRDFDFWTHPKKGNRL
jgi:hypothetical protein